MEKFAFLLICLAANRLLLVESKLFWMVNGRGDQDVRNIGVSQILSTQEYVRRQQWFLLDVLLQVHKPLVNAELAELGSELITDPAMYDEPTDPILIEFLDLCSESEVLGHGDAFSELNPEHARQLVGLTKFLTLAKDWPTFQRNVCFARQNVNPAMFVNALLTAVRDRQDTAALNVPALNEILPQLFYDRDVVVTAEAVQWSDLVSSYRKTSMRSTLKDLYSQGVLSMTNPSFWHKWYSGVRGLRDPSPRAPSEEKIVIPVQEGGPLSCLTEDVGWRIFWNNVNNERLLQAFKDPNSEGTVDDDDDRDGTINEGPSRKDFFTPEQDHDQFKEIWDSTASDKIDNMERTSSLKDPIIDGDRLMRRTNKDGMNWGARVPRSVRTVNVSPEQVLIDERRGEILVQNLQQMMARISLEKISLGMSLNTSDHGFVKAVDRQRPTATDDVSNLQRLAIKRDVKSSVQESIQQLKSIVDNVLSRVWIQPTQPQIVEVIGDILLGGGWDKPYTPIGAIFYGLNRLRQGEPMYEWALEKVHGLVENYRRRLMPYGTDQLRVTSIELLDVAVDRLVTYFDVTDSDLINLVDQQLLQSRVNNIGWVQKRLVARQRRLNHKPFTMTYNIGSQQRQHVVVRTFLGPSGDKSGGFLTLEDARPHFVLLNAFSTTLQPGVNRVQFNSANTRWTSPDPTPLSEIYSRLMSHMSPEQSVVSDCRFPHRLLLPRGIPEGLPMRLLVVVTPASTEDRLIQHTVNPEHICGLGLATLALDSHPLNFPLDRQIEDDREFLQRNMILKDVLIEHDELVGK